MQGASSLIFLVLLIGIFYFMLIRPQKKRVTEHKQLVESIDVGDDIVTIGGLYGTVTSIGDEDVEIEPSPGVKLRFVKNAISRVVLEELDDDEDEELEDDDEADDAELTASSEDDKA